MIDFQNQNMSCVLAEYDVLTDNQTRVLESDESRKTTKRISKALSNV